MQKQDLLKILKKKKPAPFITAEIDKYYCKQTLEIFFTDQFYFSLQELSLLFPVPPGGHLQGPLPEDGGMGGVGHLLLPGSPTPGPATPGLPDLPSGWGGTGAHNGHGKRWAVEDLHNL